MILVDSHAHLADQAFAADLPEVLRRAAERRVQAVVAVTETLADVQPVLDMASRFPLVKAAIGLHPAVLDEEAAAAMIELIRRHRDRLIAVGEVGLDHREVEDEGGREVQRRIFAAQAAVAREFDLPLNVHSRAAGREAISLLRELGLRRVLLHAFDAKSGTAITGAEAGFFFSIPPSIVRSPQKQKIVRHLPLSLLLLESDSPALGPVPEERNEPANVSLVVETIASLRGIAPETVAELTTENARRFFGERLGI